VRVSAWAFDSYGDSLTSSSRSFHLNEAAAIGCDELGNALQKNSRFAADPNVPVEQQSAPPPSRARDGLEYRAMQNRSAARLSKPHRIRRDVYSQGHHSPARKRQYVAARATPDIQHRRGNSG